MDRLVAIAFDTLEYARRLRQAGFDERQAEGMTQALVIAMTDTLATKRDLSELQVLLKADMRELELRLKADMAALEARLETRLTIRLGGLMLAGIGVVSALVKIL
jgi:hypothetical protein